MKNIKILIFLLSLLTILTSCSSKEISEVERLISEIDTENIDRDNIISIRQSYDKLGENQKSKVSNYQELVDAESICIEQLLTEFQLTITANIAGCIGARDAVVSIWKNAINGGYDFNIAINSLYAGQEYKILITEIVPKDLARTFKELMSGIEDRHDTIEVLVKDISAINKDSRINDAVMDLYSEYSVL